MFWIFIFLNLVPPPIDESSVTRIGPPGSRKNLDIPHPFYVAQYVLYDIVGQNGYVEPF